MIVDVPKAEDFQESGVGFLNLAWENAITLLLNIDDWGLSQADEEVSAEYWTSAQKLLATAAALAQQGLEFLLKGKITETSAFLLIADEPRKWPAGKNGKIPFADFRTIDASDLIRVHDSASTTPLPEEFTQEFTKSRQLRNAIFHTVDRRPKFKAVDILRTVLIATESLIGPRNWMRLRRKFVTEAPEAIPSGGDHLDVIMVREMAKILATFTKAEVERFIGLNKRGRRYLCYWCEHYSRDVSLDIEARFAQLVPDTEFLHCFACNQDMKVARIRCEASGCKGDVIDVDNGVCCVCYEHQEDWTPPPPKLP